LPGQLDPNEDNSEVPHCISGNAIWVVIGATAGHAGIWSSDSQVTCRLTGADKALLNGGAGGALPVQVQVSNQTGISQKEVVVICCLRIRGPIQIPCLVQN
jgi:hypothetical protein